MTDRRFLWLSIAAFAVAAALASATNAEIPRPLARPAAFVAPSPVVSPEVIASLAAPAREASLGQPVTAPPTAPIPASFTPPSVGPETNLPLPRFVSLKSDEGNVRRGPSLSHRIDWVFVRRGMPLQITAEYGHWRRVVDREGVGGWVHYALLSGSRTVIVDEPLLDILSRPYVDAQVVAQFEAGVVARLGECSIDWCQISAGGFRGWVLKAALWGVEPDEIRE